jgi:hypothetical protein
MPNHLQRHLTLTAGPLFLAWQRQQRPPISNSPLKHKASTIAIFTTPGTSRASVKLAFPHFYTVCNHLLFSKHYAADYTIFYGTASPPTSYGGYGGNAEEDFKYKFEYPTGWKTQAPNKVEKGTQGIDCRVFNPRNKSQAITVVTFGRAGEDNKSFKVTDIDTTIAGFAGADYDL